MIIADDIHTILADMPGSIRAYTCFKGDTYTIMINSRLSYEEQIAAYQHELRHIMGSDYCKDIDADRIEIYAHAV